MAVGRSENPLADFFWWVGHLGRSTRLDPVGSLNSAALEEILDGFDG
jgi:hypothetical protein